MTATQKGFSITRIGSDQSKIIAVLYNTNVAEIDMVQENMVLNTGNYPTLSTAKSLNTAFIYAGLGGMFKAQKRNNNIVLTRLGKSDIKLKNHSLNHIGFQRVEVDNKEPDVFGAL